jgi:asparagine synthase (glutamine-hydrolysing)
MEGIVPERILWNPRKVGFNAPINSFLDTRNNEIKQWLLDDGPIFSHVRKPMIEALLKKENLPNSESKFLFYFLCAKFFLEEFDL